MNHSDANVWNVVASAGGLVHCWCLDEADEGHTRESGKLLKMLLSELCFSEITSVLDHKIPYPLSALMLLLK